VINIETSSYLIISTYFGFSHYY